jgi:hypothetical protein
MRTTSILGIATLGLAAAFGHGHAQDEPPEACSAAAGMGQASGTVVDVESGVPIGRARAVLTWTGAAQSGRRREQRTDANGRFLFCDVPAGVRASVRIEYLDESVAGDPTAVLDGGDVTFALTVKAPHVRVQGRVIEAETGTPIGDATLRIAGTPLSRVSAADGSFTIEGLPPGEYALEAEHLAYRAWTDSLEVEFDTDVTLEVRMATSAIPLEPLVVDVRSLMLERRGFYMRMDRGVGAFFTRDRIGAMLPRIPTDLLWGVAGITMQPRRDGFGLQPVGRRGCGFRYFLDGTRVGAGFEIDDVPVESIEAIEVYAGISTVPADFSALMHEQRGNCGVIVIWTRNRV